MGWSFVSDTYWRSMIKDRTGAWELTIDDGTIQTVSLTHCFRGNCFSGVVLQCLSECFFETANLFSRRNVPSTTFPLLSWLFRLVTNPTVKSRRHDNGNQLNNGLAEFQQPFTFYRVDMPLPGAPGAQNPVLFHQVLDVLSRVTVGY